MPLFENDTIEVDTPRGVMVLPRAVAGALGLSPAYQSPALMPPAPQTPEEIAAENAQISANVDQRYQAFKERESREQAAQAAQLAQVDQNIKDRHQAWLGRQPQPRTDAARIAQTSAPIGTVAQIGQNVNPTAGPQVTPNATFTPEQLAQLQAAGPKADAISGVSPIVPTTAQDAAVPGEQAPQGPQPTTAQDLRSTGAAGVFDAQSGALDMAAQAGKDLADAEAQQQTEFANAYDDRNTEIDKQLAARAKDAENKQRLIDQRMTEYEAAAQKYGSSKIDRSVDHPIAAAIAAALGAIGSAITGDGTKNAATDLMFKQIERKAQAQMDERMHLKDLATSKRGDIDLLRQRASDSTAQHNLVIAGEIEKATRQIEAIGARSQSPIIKQRAAVAASELQARKADALGQAVNAQMGKDERDRAFAEQARAAKVNEANDKSRIALGWAGHAENKRQFGLNFDENKRQFDAKLAADRDAAMLAAQAKGNKADMKDFVELEKLNAELGVSDVATGAPLLQPEGRKLMDDAKALDAKAEEFARAAQTEQDPAKKAQLEQAAQLHAQGASERRGEADLRYRFRTKDAKELTSTIAATQTALTTVDDIKRLAADTGKAWVGTSAKEQALRTKGTQLMLTLKEAYQTGTLDKGSVEVLNKMTGGDPTKITWGNFTAFMGNASDTSGALEAIADGLTSRAKNQARAKGYRGELEFKRLDFKPAETSPVEGEAKKLQQFKTPLEQAEGKAPGTGRKVVESVLYPFGGSPSEKAARQAEESGSVKYVGFSKEQEAPLEAVLGAAKLGDKTAIEQLKHMRQDSSRPSMQNATRLLLEAHLPDLETQVGGAIAARVDGNMPVETLLAGARAGDAAARTEIIRRATSGDAAAQRALEAVVNSKGAR